MSAPANFVVVENGSWELYYSHWAAPGYMLALEDPVEGSKFIRGLGPEVSTWMDEGCCESAVLIDHDQRRLLYFSVHIDGYASRTAELAGLRRTWRGWRADWAYDGLADLVAHLGLDRSLVRETSNPPNEPIFDPYDAQASDGPDCLVTVADAGPPRAYALEITYWTSIIDCGPRVVGVLSEDCRVTECALIPYSGVHIDLRTRMAGAWTIGTLEGALARAPQRWPGWRWEFWEDRYGEQLARAEGAVTLASFDPQGPTPR